MYRFFISFLFAGISQIIIAQDSVSVLFIGNSYTYVNDLPSLLNSLTNSKGDKLTFDSQTIGGATFNNHASNTATYTKIHSNPWDFVILQGQSQEVSFSESQVNLQSLPYVKQIADSIYNAKYCTDLMLFMTWGYINGDAQWAPISTYEGMQSRIRNGYQRIADSVQASVSPVGMAWKYTRENYPSINLYSVDGSHPSLEGSYLAACTFYSALFRKSPVGATFYSSLPQATAEQLQLAAEAAVMDSLEIWHLRSIQNHTVADFSIIQNGDNVICTNLSWKAQSFFWNFDDGSTSMDENPIHSYSLNGSFTITLDALSECNNDQFDETIQIITAGLNDFEKSFLRMLTLQNGHFIIIGDNIEEESIKLFDLNGKQLSTWEMMNNQLNIDLSHEPIGIYRIVLNNLSFSLMRN